MVVKEEAMDERTLKRLKSEVGLQNGESGSEKALAKLEKAASKVVWHRGADFGSPVEIHWRGDGEFEGDLDYGYLMGLPGADSPDMDGVVHIPHPAGEKEEADPVWMAYTAVAALPDVEKVVIGTPPATADGATPTTPSPDAATPVPPKPYLPPAVRQRVAVMQKVVDSLPALSRVRARALGWVHGFEGLKPKSDFDRQGMVEVYEEGWLEGVENATHLEASEEPPRCP